MRTALALSVVCLTSLACMGLPGGEAPAEGGGGSPGLRTDLEGGCYGQPDAEWTPDNHAEVEVFVERGERAIDFRFPRVDGGEAHLGTLLQTKPVIVFSGSYSCPVYRRNRKKIDQMARRMGDKLHIVVVYGPEAHPENDNSPYRGDNWSKPDKYSHVDCADSDEERMENAKKVGGSGPVIEVVEPIDNPFWCTYGTAPNAAYLINQDGTFEAVHDWFDTPTMVQSIEAMLGERGGGGGRGRGGRGRR
jgi:hypothetical protein